MQKFNIKAYIETVKSQSIFCHDQLDKVGWEVACNAMPWGEISSQIPMMSLSFYFYSKDSAQRK